MSIEAKSAHRVLLLARDAHLARDVVRDAVQRRYAVDWHRSLHEIGPVGRLSDYDSLVCDVDLDHVTGLEVARYAASLLGGLPVILLHAPDGSRRALGALPANVVATLPRHLGSVAVLDALDRTQAPLLGAVRRRYGLGTQRHPTHWPDVALRA